MAVMTIERPESVEEVPPQNEQRRHAEVVRDVHDQIDPPEGYRVEIVDGNIVMSASPFGKHAHIVARIRRAILPSLPTQFEVYDNTTLEDPYLQRYVPDLAIWPVELVDTETEWVFSGNQCLLAVEVTSPGQERRDHEKAKGYARSDVPIYLLVDRKQRVCILCTEPEGDRYKDRHELAFGKPVTLPLDPPVTIDTSDF